MIDIRDHGGALSGNGLKIKGARETLVASGDIERGDFITKESVLSPSFATVKANTQLKVANYHLDTGINIKVDDKTSIILWYYPNQTPLYADAMTVDNAGVVTAGVSTTILPGVIGNVFGISKLSGNRYLITYIKTGALDLYFALIVVNGTSVTVLSNIAKTVLNSYAKNASVLMMTNTIGILAIPVGSQPLGVTDTVTRYFGLITIGLDSSITIGTLTTFGKVSNYSYILDFYKVNDNTAILLQDGESHEFSYVNGVLTRVISKAGFPISDGYLVDTMGNDRIIVYNGGIGVVQTGPNNVITLTLKLSLNSFYTSGVQFRLDFSTMIYRGTGLINEGYTGFAHNILRVNKHKYIIVTRGINNTVSDSIMYPIVAASFSVASGLVFKNTQREVLVNCYVSRNSIFSIYNGTLLSLMWNDYYGGGSSNTRYSRYFVTRNNGSFYDSVFKVNDAKSIDGVALNPGVIGQYIDIMSPNI